MSPLWDLLRLPLLLHHQWGPHTFQPSDLWSSFVCAEEWLPPTGGDRSPCGGGNPSVIQPLSRPQHLFLCAFILALGWRQIIQLLSIFFSFDVQNWADPKLTFFTLLLPPAAFAFPHQQTLSRVSRRCWASLPLLIQLEPLTKRKTRVCGALALCVCCWGAETGIQTCGIGMCAGM